MVALYTLTSILSAFLVFLIEPVAAKYALPTLGGIPAVWNGCMLFFQVMLLLGYLYAHGLSKWCKPRVQPFIHLALILLAVALFPTEFSGPASADPVHQPMSWLMGMLFYSIALPFFVICSTSPLLQRWFSYTNHPKAHNPYFLYAASNIGSMSALLLYPVAIEPFLRLKEQVNMWEAGIMVLLLAFAGLAYYVFTRSTNSQTTAAQTASTQRITWPMRLRWLTLAFVPASLLYGVTAYITSDIASAPMLWLLPLTLYLITFIAVFATRPRGIDVAISLHLPCIVILLNLLSIQFTNTTGTLIAHLTGVFIITWAVHGLLARSKPHADNLTEFFLWMSLGGVLGGVFNTLTAPFIFNSVVEYWLILALSCLVHFESFGQIKNDISKNRKYIMAYAIGSVVFIGSVTLIHNLGNLNADEDAGAIKALTYISSAIIAVASYFAYTKLKFNYACFTLCLLILVVSGQYSNQLYKLQDVVLKTRSIFGTYIVSTTDDQNLFIHGTTAHGMQFKTPEKRLLPTYYYVPLATVFDKMPASLRQEPFALVGLGVGTSICYAKPNQRVDIYEIDPLVEEIAGNRDYFTYLTDCPGEKQVILGDARQQILRQPDDSYGIIIMDAFSSDAIPAHLITKEALEIYLSKLKPNGIIAFHVSNRHLELRYVLAAITQELGIHGAHKAFETDEDSAQTTSVWVTITKDDATLQRLLADGWQTLPETPKKMLWTDDFSNLFFTFHFMSPYLDLPPLKRE